MQASRTIHWPCSHAWQDRSRRNDGGKLVGSGASIRAGAIEAVRRCEDACSCQRRRQTVFVHGPETVANCRATRLRCRHAPPRRPWRTQACEACEAHGSALQQHRGRPCGYASVSWRSVERHRCCTALAPRPFSHAGLQTAKRRSQVDFCGTNLDPCKSPVWRCSCAEAIPGWRAGMTRSKKSRRCQRRPCFPA